MLSIIIPCYNSKDYIKRAINSILNIAFKDLEIVVVDDGSIDNTFDIVKEFSSKDKRVKLFHKDNGGYPSAVNYGLENIKGDYFMILGSDDEVIPDFFNQFEKFNTNNKYDIIFFKTKIIDENNNTYDDSLTLLNNEISFENSSLNLIESNKSSLFNLCVTRDTSRIYKTSLLKENRYFGKYGVDSDGIFSSLFCRKCKNFLFLAHYGYLWHQRTNSVSYKINSKKYHEDRMDIWDKYFSIITSNNDIPLLNNDFSCLNRYIYVSKKYRKTYLVNFKKARFFKEHLKNIKSYYSHFKDKKIAKRTILFLKFPITAFILK